jgi:hypothetical protein
MEPVEQAHRRKGQLTRVLLWGEVVKRMEKGGGALGGFSSRSGKRGRRNGEGEGIRGRHPHGDRRRNERGEQRWTARAVRHCPNRGA